MFFVLCVRCSAKILILNKEGIIEKTSYERRAYESVDEKSLSLVMSRKTTKKKIMHLRDKVQNSIHQQLLYCIDLMFIKKYEKNDAEGKIIKRFMFACRKP